MQSSSSHSASSPRTATFQNLNIEEAIKKWKKKSTVDPYNNTEVKTSIVLKSKYVQLYEKFINNLTSGLTPTDIINPEIFENIRKQLPTDHIYVFKDIDYLKNLKQQYNDLEENKWIDFLVKQKKLLYGKEQILDKKGYTVYDHLFMHFYFIKNKQHFNEITKYIHNQEFLYETIENQIKLVKAVDMNCHEVIDSMLKFTNKKNKGINFQLKNITGTTDKWLYEVPPLLKLFIQYVYEISHYLISIQRLDAKIYNDYFLYGYKIPRLELGIEKKIEVIDYSIKYNKNRLKTILNLILGSMYNSDNSEKINIKTFLKILWIKVKNVILKEQKFIYDNWSAGSYSQDKQVNYKINREISDSEIKNFKMFFVSSIFDIETAHKESQEHNNLLYEPVIDPYNNLREPPKMPRAPIISQDLQRYKMTSDIKGKNSQKEKELKEHLEKEKQFKKELKSYDKKLKEYNDKHLGKKLSPYFSVKLSRAKSVINDKNSLRLSYLPLKVSAKSLTKFKSKKQKELLSNFEKEPYSRTYKQNEIDKETQRIERFREAKRQREIEREREREIARQEIERQRFETERAREREQERARQEIEGEQQREWLRARSDSISSHYSESPHSDIRSRSSRSTSSGYSSSGGEPKKAYLQMVRGGGSKEPLSKSDLKLQLALEAHKFKEFAKSLSPSSKSPRQKYVGCDLNDNDPITQQTFGELHFKKIKYLSKIKTVLPNGKTITHCYDTIPYYNYILDCNNKGKKPLNLIIGKVPLTQEQQNEVFKKIKFFTKQPTLETKTNFLKAKYKENVLNDTMSYNTYKLEAQINIGSIDFDLTEYVIINLSASPVVLHEGPIISRDDILFENTSDKTVLLIQEGIANGSLLKVNSYPYWKNDFCSIRTSDCKLLALPSFTFSTRDSIQELEERTKIFNNSLKKLI